MENPHLKLNAKLPKALYVACSGGVDSVVLFHVLKRNHDVIPLYVDHGDQAAAHEISVVRALSDRTLIVKIDPVIPSGTSREFVWSQRRHEVFSTMDRPVVLAHHLDDCVETWISSCLQGKPTLINKYRGNAIRPFMLNSKADIETYAIKKGLFWVNDPTNADPEFATRNFVRNIIVPEALKVNPGLRKTVKKLLLARDKEEV